MATADDRPTAEDFQRMVQARVGLVRIPIHWPTIQPTEGTYDWSKLDPVVANAAAYGIDLLPFYYATPPWLANCSGIPEPGFCERASPLQSANGAAAFSQFLNQFVRRYGPTGTFWSDPTDAFSPPFRPIRNHQNWNEENSYKYYRPRVNVREFAQLQMLFAQAIRSVDPGAKLYLGGLFGTPPVGMTMWNFLSKLYAVRGIKDAFDVVALHPYSPNVKGIEFQLEKAREVLKKKKDAKTPIALTELGWSSSGGAGRGSGLYKGLAGQAKLLKQSFKFIRKNRKRYKIIGLNWFTWRDTPAGFGGHCLTCESAGLFTSSFAPKPSLGAFTRFTGGS